MRLFLFNKMKKSISWQSFSVQFSGHIAALLPLVFSCSAQTQTHIHTKTHAHTYTHTQAPVVLVSSQVHSIICWLNNDFKKSSKLIKKKACVKLALSLLTFLISYIELQDLFDNFQKIWCTVFNIGLFCCMCCILFKNWTNWGLCYKWQSFLCIICLINWFSTMGGYWLFVPGAEMQVFRIFKLSFKTPVLSSNQFLCWLNICWTADSAQWPDGSVWLTLPWVLCKLFGKNSQTIMVLPFEKPRQI